MASSSIVEAFDEFEDRMSRLSLRLEAAPIEQLGGKLLDIVDAFDGWLRRHPRLRLCALELQIGQPRQAPDGESSVVWQSW